MLDKIVKNWALYSVLIIAFLFFVLKFDIHVLDFTFTDWVYNLSFDPGSELVAFNNYRHTPQYFPIAGRLELGDYPAVTGIGMTSMVALMGMFFRPFAPILPIDFQYFGLWFLLCFLLQGWFGLRLMKNALNRYGATPPQYSSLLLILSTTFFIIAPPFLFRYGHLIIVCHFFVLAALSIYFSDALPKKKWIHSLWLCAAVAGVSQYMTTMAFAIVAATFFDMWRRDLISFKTVLGYLFGNLMVIFLMFYLIGLTLAPLSTAQTEGFGIYSSNLNTFYNPQNFSRFLPELPHSNRGQYEGFGYLGLGTIILIFIGLGTIFLKKSHKTDLINPIKKWSFFNPLICVMTLFFIYALSNKIGWNDKVIHEWRYGSGAAMLFETLRGSGRFIMVPFYGIMVWGFVRFFRLPIAPVIKVGILSSLLCLQIVDIQSLFRIERRIFIPCAVDNSCKHEKWKPLMQEASRVIMFAPYAWSFKRENDFYTFIRAASEVGKPITTGYFARRNQGVTQAYHLKLYKDWEHGDLAENDKAIYIGSLDKIWRFEKLVNRGVLIPFQYDGYAVLVPSTLTQTLNLLAQLPEARKISFDTEGVADIIKKYSNNTVIMVANHEASESLLQSDKEKMANMGAPLFSKLSWTGAYMAIFSKGKCIFEKLDNDKALEQIWQKGESINGFSLKKALKLYSAGADKGNRGSIFIENTDYSLNKRGINFVIIDDNFEVIVKDYLDTYEQGMRGVVK